MRQDNFTTVVSDAPLWRFMTAPFAAAVIARISIAGIIRGRPPDSSPADEVPSLPGDTNACAPTGEWTRLDRRG